MNKEKAVQETLEFIENDLWDLSKVLDDLSDLVGKCCYKKSINHKESIMIQYQYLNAVKSLYMPKYEYLFLFIKNTGLRKGFIAYTQEYVKKWPDEKLNEDIFRNQYIYSKYGDTSDSLFQYDFYTVVDYLYEIIYLYKYLKENS